MLSSTARPSAGPVNVWAQRAAAKAKPPAHPQNSSSLPLPPSQNDDPFVVRTRRAQPQTTEAWPTVMSANGHPPTPSKTPSKKPTPAASPAALSSTLPTPAFSSPATSGAVSPAEPPRASGSGSPSSSSAAVSPPTSTAAIPPSTTPSKSKTRKWVPIPPEELRAAAEKHQRTTTKQHRGVNGFAVLDRGRPGRKSQTQSAATSRAESVVSHDREGEPLLAPPQPEQQAEYTTTASNPYLDSNPNATRYSPQQPYYSHPYTGYDSHPDYWSTNPPIPSENSEWKEPPQLPTPFPKPPPHNHYRDGWRPLYWWQNPPQTEAPQPLQQPAESAALTTSESNAAPSAPTRVILFGTVDAVDLAMNALTKTEPRRRKQPPSSLPASATTPALIPGSTSASSLPTSTSAPAQPRIRDSGWRTSESEVERTLEPPSGPALTTPTSKHDHQPLNTPKASSSSTTIAGLPLSASKPALFAIGVSPRARAARLAEDPDVEVVDLTISLGGADLNSPVGEPNTASAGGFGGQWEFGTTWSENSGSGAELQAPSPPQEHHQPQGPPPIPYMYPFWGYPYDMSMYGYPPPHHQQHIEGMPPAHPLGIVPPPMMMGMPAYGPPPPLDTDPNGGGSGNGSASVSPTAERSRGGSEWEVRDFGYGFGNGKGTTNNASSTSELVRASVLRQPRDYELSPVPPPVSPFDERERSNAREFEARSPTTPREFDGPVYGRPRRGSYSAFNNSNNGFEPRGGYGGGRRGRGFRGTHRGFRGTGVYGPPPPPRSTAPAAMYHQPSYGGTPPQTYIPVPAVDYYNAENAQAISAYYATQGPVPRTRLSFPIDRLRVEILSQIEFYLSPDNMATDFYLRQQMDSKGWIPIKIIAAFNRVQSKTTDLELIRDVLALSEYAEIRGEWVRSKDTWDKFVLPTAKPSVVEDAEEPPLLMRSEGDAAGDEEQEEDEEEDVVFVMDREEKAWSPALPR